LVTANSDRRFPARDSTLVSVGRSVKLLLTFASTIAPAASTSKKTPLPRIPTLLSDALSYLLRSGGPRVVDAEACFVAVETCLPAVA
jgi:hypothetical protein